MSLFKRLLYWSIATVFLVIGLLSLSNSQHISSIAIQSTRQLLTSRLEATKSYFIDQYITNISNDLTLLSQAPSLNNLIASPQQEKKFHRVEVAKFFQRVIKTNSTYKKLEVFDAEGLQLLAITPNKRLFQYQNLRKLLTKNELIHEKASLFNYMYQNQGEEILTSYPLITRNGDMQLLSIIGLTDPDIGKFGGAVIVTVSLQTFLARLNELFKQTSDSQTAVNIKLIDNQNNRVLIDLQSNVSAIPGQKYFESIFDPLTNDIDLVISDNLPLTLNNSKYLTLEFELPKEVIYSQILSSLTPVISTAGLILLLSILFSTFISRSVALPITELSRASGQLSKGDFSVVVSEDVHGSELKLLSKAFNQIGQSLRKHTEEVSFLAYHDPLTKLPNRLQFIRHINNLIDNYDHSETKGFAIIFIDLDDFKGINDNFGHQVGDQLLCQVSNLIVSNLRSGDYIALTNHINHLPPKEREVVARIGGDEFLICLPHISQPEQVSQVAERLLDALQQPLQIGKEELYVEASLGIVMYPHSGRNADELIKFADIAMYAAKEEGKRTYCHFSPEMSLRLKSIAEVERELRKAQHHFEQFYIVYQPLIDIASNQMTGAEALLRWNHPSKNISPTVFIDVAETTGLILPLGEWVINKTCQQLADWQDILPQIFYITINLSPKQIHRQNVAEIFQKKIQSFNIPPQQLHVEVTENLLMKDEKKAKRTIDEIRSLGIQVWLDDFGTGYSSLSYLRKFQFDGVKIDRSFVSDIGSDAHDQALCSAIISMANDLEMKVVAEGVENKLQADFLAQKKCCIGQGYYYSKPLSAEDFAKYFYEQKKFA